jgi:hypothetical protein
VKKQCTLCGRPKKTRCGKSESYKLKTYAISNASKPGKTVVNKNTVNVYRPVINNDKTVVNNNQTTYQ